MSDTINYFYIENAYAGSNTVTVTRIGTYQSGQMVASLQYSKDLENWSNIDLTVSGDIRTVELTLNEGETVYFRNDNGKFSYSNNNYIHFNASNLCMSGGNIMSLLNYNDMLNTQLSQNCFCGMFYNFASLTTAPELPATTLAEDCYADMFYYTSLTTAPELPATTLADGCYKNMFRECASLTTAPELPATTLADGCYQAMFGGCTSLTTAPELPATTLAEDCYQTMFIGCTSLNEVTIYANDISAEGCLLLWLDGVSETGTFHKNGFAVYSKNSSGIPSGWTVVTPFIYNNIIKFDYSADTSELLDNIWVQTYTDTTQNTVIPQGETHEETIERNWRTITFSIEGKPGYSGVFRIEVDDNGVPVQPYNYENISGDAIIDVLYEEGGPKTDDSLTAYIDDKTFITMSPFVSATPSTQYQGWIFTESTESETIIVADYYSVTLYVNSLIDTFETTMFENDTNLLTIELPDVITTITDDAFNGCTNLNTVTMYSTIPPTISTDTFTSVTATLYVPYEALGQYRSEYVGIFTDILPISIPPVPPTPTHSYGFNLSGMKNVDYGKQGVIILRN